MIHPNFRGTNNNPDACGSEKVIRDIIDAVNFAKENANIEKNRIYLAGCSGGGHLSLLLAGKTPDIWAAITSWVPITDLALWHKESKKRNNGYDVNLEKVCGGYPGSSEKIDNEYRERSPIYFIHNAKKIPIDINAGIHDGHTGAVPISHSFYAFNKLAQAGGFTKNIVEESYINYFIQNRTVPGGLKWESADDISYNRKIHFRRSAGNARITIFEGGHEIIYEAAFEWLNRHRK